MQALKQAALMSVVEENLALATHAGAAGQEQGPGPGAGAAAAAGSNVGGGVEPSEHRLTRTRARTHAAQKQSGSVLDVPLYADVPALLAKVDKARSDLTNKFHAAFLETGREVPGTSGKGGERGSFGTNTHGAGTGAGAEADAAPSPSISPDPHRTDGRAPSRSRSRSRSQSEDPSSTTTAATTNMASSRQELLSELGRQAEKVLEDCGMRLWRCLVPAAAFPLPESACVRAFRAVHICISTCCACCACLACCACIICPAYPISYFQS